MSTEKFTAITRNETDLEGFGFRGVLARERLVFWKDETLAQPGFGVDLQDLSALINFLRETFLVHP